VLRPLCLCLAGIFAYPAQAGQVCDTSRFALSTPTERFVDNGDGTITDRVTQLMWRRCASGQGWESDGCQGEPLATDWTGAQAVADQLNSGTDHFYSDWRLPSLTEMAGIVERQCQAPTINLMVFPNAPSGIFWSSTVRPKDEDLVYALGFGGQGAAPVSKVERHHVRLVRTGP